MPELPDVLLYEQALRARLVGQKLKWLKIRSPSVLRTYQPSVDELVGQNIAHISRSGKRIVWHFSTGTPSTELFLVFHLMIAGRFHWKNKLQAPTSKSDLAAFGFELNDSPNTLMFTEASTKKRAGLWCLRSIEEVAALNRGGIDVLSSSDAEIVAMLRCHRNTLKRALTDPSRFDGIGNAYSDEILHQAKLSPLRRTDQLDDEEAIRLAHAMRSTLLLWIERIKQQAGDGFPERVTALRADMAVHGKFGANCPICSAPIQRIRYGENECNYCPGCQTQGRILADRSLSRLLRDDWPRRIEDLE